MTTEGRRGRGEWRRRRERHTAAPDPAVSRKTLYMVVAGALVAVAVLGAWIAIGHSGVGAPTSPPVAAVGRGHERDVIFLQTDYADVACAQQNLDSVFARVMPALGAAEFARARALLAKGDSLRLDVYAIGNELGRLQFDGQDGVQPNWWRIAPSEARWESAAEIWQEQIRDLLAARIGRADGTLYNVIGAIQTIDAAPLTFIDTTAIVTRLIFVGDMVHYDTGPNGGTERHQANLFRTYDRKQLEAEVARDSLAGTALRPIVGGRFAVYGISMPRCVPPVLGNAMAVDYPTVQRELWPIWRRVFERLGASTAAFGLDGVDMIH